MANKKLQYQDISRSPFVAAAAIAVFSTFSQPLPTLAKEYLNPSVANAPFVPPPQTAVFTTFSQPVCDLNPALSAAWLNSIAPLNSVPFVFPTFSQFSQPSFSRTTLPDELPFTFFENLPAPSNPMFFFAQFIPVLHANLPVAVDFANFAHLTPPDFPPIQELHDGGFVKKKRKLTRREKFPYEEEAEVKRKRRQAIEEAIYGPPVEYTLPPLAFPPSLPAPPQLGDLPQIMLAAQQKRIVEARLKQIRDEEEELEQILKDIL